MANDRLYRPRRGYRGEHKDAGELAKDLHEEFKRLEAVSTNADKDIDTAQAAADAAQSAADGLFVPQQNGAQKTDAGTAFAPTAGTWTDLPGTGGTGTVEKTIITTGGTVKASLTVNWAATGSQNDVEIRIMADSVDGVQIAGTHLSGTVTSGGAVHEIFSPFAGSHTYKARGRRIGSNNFDLNEVDLTVTEID